MLDTLVNFVNMAIDVCIWCDVVAFSLTPNKKKFQYHHYGIRFRTNYLIYQKFDLFDHEEKEMTFSLAKGPNARLTDSVLMD